jgi:hypothetical protein
MQALGTAISAGPGSARCTGGKPSCHQHDRQRRTRRPRAVAAAATAGDGGPQQQQLSLSLRSARANLLSLLDAEPPSSGNSGLYRGANADGVAAAVDLLIKDNPSLTPGTDTPSVGVGVWEVRGGVDFALAAS